MTNTEKQPQLIGRVLNELGEPLSGAQIVATNSSFLRLPTDALLSEAAGAYDAQVVESSDDGRFKITDGLDPGGSLAVSVVAEGYAPLRYPHERLSRDLPHDLGDLIVKKGHSIQGIVVDEAGNPLADTLILMALERGVPGCVQSYPGRGIPVAKTDADGRFDADGLLPGRWLLLFDKMGYRVEEVQGNFFNSPPPSDLKVTLYRSRSISGRLLNVPPELVGKLMVEARPIRRKVDYVKQFPSRGRPRRAFVQSDGTFQIDGLNEEPFQPHIQPFVVQGYHSQITTNQEASDIWLVVGMVTEQDQRLIELPEVQTCRVEPGQTEIELPWLGRANFAARVVNEAGDPVELHSVEVRYESGFGPDQDMQQANILRGGLIELRDYAAWDFHHQYWKPSRKVCLWIRAVGYEFREVEIQNHLIRGEHTDVGNITLKAIPTTKLQVTDHAGKAVPQAELRLAELKENWLGMLTTWAYQHKQREPGSWDWNFPYHCLTVATNDQGKAEVSQVVEKTEMLSVSHPEYAFQVHAIEASSESTRKIYPARIKLAPAGKIVVKVVEETGLPAPWRPVFLEALDVENADSDETAELRGYRFKGVTDAKGMATFDRLHGRYLVALVHPEEGRRPDSRRHADEHAIAEVAGDAVEVTLTAWPLYEFSISVRESDRPVIGATLDMMSEYLCTPDESYRRLPWRGLTDDSGHCRFRDVPPGDYVLRVNHDDRNMKTRRIVHVGPNMEPIDWLLDNNTITGKLVDRSGKPLPYKCIGIKTEVNGYGGGNDAGITYENGRGGLDWFWSGPWIHETWTDADGNFHLRGLAAGLPIHLYTSHHALAEAKLDLDPLQAGEQRNGITFAAEPAGDFRMLYTSKLPDINDVKHRALLYPLDDAGNPIPEKVREKELPYPHPIKSCSVGRWLISVERMSEGSLWEKVLNKEITVVAGETQEVIVGTGRE